ncbi:MAG: proprotein convertase P-domain-containing protein [Bacteroidetes bacterium]|nr:proprotein convertase P-domain-containing protein [Bacteroidota bacterium]
MKYLLTLLVWAIFITAKAQTFSQVFNQAIPDDGSTVMYLVPVSGLPTAIDTNFGLEGICIQMTHTWDDDMEVKLMSPDGTTVLMFTRRRRWG